jgi:hypothetical protein
LVSRLGVERASLGDPNSTARSFWKDRWSLGWIYLDTVKDLLVHSPTSQWTNASCICAKKPSTRSIALLYALTFNHNLGREIG